MNARNWIVIGLIVVLALTVLFVASSVAQEQESPNRQATSTAQPSSTVVPTETDATTQSSDLPLPSSLPLADYEEVLYRWLMERQYQTLGWAVDKSVRDTGPFLLNIYYGTHPAVRIYYSPEVIDWLQNDRQGDIPDGAMIIKEMFTPPAALYEELKNDPKYQNDPDAYDALLAQLISAWTVMVRDSAGSNDGWFWANPGAAHEGEAIEDAIARQLDNYTHILYSDFGAPCLRCHSSAEAEFTFSALSNIEGFLPDEDPLRFTVDNSWRRNTYFCNYPLSLLADDPFVQSLFELPAQERPYSGEDDSTCPSPAPPAPKTSTLVQLQPEFGETFEQISNIESNSVKAFPMNWADHVVAGPDGAELYITSDNCLGCHGGLGGIPYGPTMFVRTGSSYGDGYNLSEFGEWRWSPMGLAGRDPIFYAQLESEMALLASDARRGGLLVGSLAENQQAVVNTCLSCHGAMGQRQLQIDAAADDSLDPNFKVDYVYLSTALSEGEPLPDNYAYHKYGELAREGISCTICHHIDAPNPSDVEAWDPPQSGWLTQNTPKELAYYLFHNTTGRYAAGPADELFGPFEQVAVVPMQHSLEITPTHNTFVTDSQLCGTCHTINLPNIGMEEDEFPVLTAAEQNPTLQSYNHSIEQATFLEWQNSIFAASGANFKSCQDCHMPNSFETSDGSIDIPQLVMQIASIQDTSYPQAEYEVPNADISVPLRSDYKRHEHVGLNVFLLEIFRQFTSILGVDQTDYMTSATTGNALAIDNMLRQAQNDTVDLAVQVESFDKNVLTVDVTVTNKTGHRFPSGVAFRRAFLEFLVLNGDEVIWSSGRTNGVGVIVDGNGRPLDTEFLPDSNTYQHHYQTITEQEQVQIYEELTQNDDDEFTTSFIHRVHHIKDNRLLPRGWRASSFFQNQGEVILEFMEATDPVGDYVLGNAEKNIPPDSDYEDQGPNFPGQDQLQYVVALPEGLDAANLSVKVTMYYQAIPPYWLNQRFSIAPDGDATQRLYYLTSHLNTEGTPIDDWKLPLVSQTVEVE